MYTISVKLNKISNSDVKNIINIQNHTKYKNNIKTKKFCWH